MSLKDAMHQEKRWEPTQKEAAAMVDNALEQRDAQTGRVSEILAQREKTHGSFALNAICAEAMYELFETSWMASHDNKKPHPVFRKAIRMVCFKIARMACNHLEQEHYDDAKGYLDLAWRYRQ